MLEMNPKIFKAYDVRGVYPEEINEDAAYRIGRAFAVFLGCKKVVVGRDMRDSSEALFSHLARGLNDQGVDVVDIGLVTTPMLNFSVAHYGYDGGIMISASHNPSQYNAFKLIAPPALQIGAGSGMEEIKALAVKNEFRSAGTEGKIFKKEVLDDYLTHIKRFTGNIKGLKIVCDYGNGVGAISAKPLLDSLPVECIHLFEIPKGSFPNHPANPHEIKNFQDIQKAIRENHADIGLFFDGDADRSIVLDENGEIIFPDMITCLLVQSELKGHEGEKVYFDLRFSKVTKEEIVKNKGVPVMMKVGNPFYKEKLIKEGGLFGAELSGHMMFKENYSIDDGLFAAVKVLNSVCISGKKVSELIAPFRRYFQSPEISTKVDDAPAVLDRVKARYSDGQLLEIDGIHVTYPDWWFSLRKSNTEPLVRLRLEADTQELLEQKKEELLAIIRGNAQG